MDRAIKLSIAVAAAVLLFLGAAGQRDNSFRFAVIGDRTGGANPEIYDRVWREVDQLHPDFVLNVGDTIEGGSDQRAEQDWAALRPIWARYKKYPLYFTPGNHDVFSETSRKLFEKETGRPAWFSFNYQNAHFTVLDNSGSDELPEAQLEFVRRDLEQNKERSPKFILFH